MILDVGNFDRFVLHKVKLDYVMIGFGFQSLPIYLRNQHCNKNDINTNYLDVSTLNNISLDVNIL